MDPAVLPAVERALQGLRYGSVQLVIHEGKLVRVERIERVRLSEQPGSLHSSLSRPTPSREDRSQEGVE